MEELLKNYYDVKLKVEQYETQLEKLKKKIKEKVKELPKSTFENNNYKVMLRKLKRSGISKRDIPCTIWEQYSVITPYEMISIRDKSKKISRRKKRTDTTSNNSS